MSMSISRKRRRRRRTKVQVQKMTNNTIERGEQTSEPGGHGPSSQAARSQENELFIRHVGFGYLLAILDRGGFVGGEGTARISGPFS